jgi:serine/threonine-protein kinase
MAPEEFKRGRLIDERTTVFTLGRAAAIFLDDWSDNSGRRVLPHAPSRSDHADSGRAVTEIACAPDPAARYPSVAALAEAFDAAVPA